jgi:hypothetical protein
MPQPPGRWLERDGPIRPPSSSGPPRSTRAADDDDVIITGEWSKGKFTREREREREREECGEHFQTESEARSRQLAKNMEREVRICIESRVCGSNVTSPQERLRQEESDEALARSLLFAAPTSPSAAPARDGPRRASAPPPRSVAAGPSAAPRRKSCGVGTRKSEVEEEEELPDPLEVLIDVRYMPRLSSLPRKRTDNRSASWRLLSSQAECQNASPLGAASTSSLAD